MEKQVSLLQMMEKIFILKYFHLMEAKENKDWS